jgi:hypothetical protein
VLKSAQSIQNSKPGRINERREEKSRELSDKRQDGRYEIRRPNFEKDSSERTNIFYGN